MAKVTNGDLRYQDFWRLVATETSPVDGVVVVSYGPYFTRGSAKARLNAFRRNIESRSEGWLHILANKQTYSAEMFAWATNMSKTEFDFKIQKGIMQWDDEL